MRAGRGEDLPNEQFRPPQANDRTVSGLQEAGHELLVDGGLKYGEPQPAVPIWREPYPAVTGTGGAPQRGYSEGPDASVGHVQRVRQILVRLSDRAQESGVCLVAHRRPYRDFPDGSEGQHDGVEGMGVGCHVLVSFRAILEYFTNTRIPRWLHSKHPQIAQITQMDSVRSDFAAHRRVVGHVCNVTPLSAGGVCGRNRAVLEYFTNTRIPRWPIRVFVLPFVDGSGAGKSTRHWLAVSWDCRESQMMMASGFRRSFIKKCPSSSA